MVDPEILLQLREVIPFRFLKQAALQAFAGKCRSASFGPGDAMMIQGDIKDRTCFILLSGLVEVTSFHSGNESRVSTIEPFHYFGE